MSVGLDGEHEVLRDEVREFFEAEVRPVVSEYVESGDFPYEPLEKISNAGYHGGPYPEEYGGSGWDFRGMAVVQEELSRIWKYLAGEMNVSWSLDPSSGEFVASPSSAQHRTRQTSSRDKSIRLTTRTSWSRLSEWTGDIDRSPVSRAEFLVGLGCSRLESVFPDRGVSPLNQPGFRGDDA